MRYHSDKSPGGEPHVAREHEGADTGREVGVERRRGCSAAKSKLKGRVKL